MTTLTRRYFELLIEAHDALGALGAGNDALARRIAAALDEGADLDCGLDAAVEGASRITEKEPPADT
jgi:hypothetical protein